MKTFNILLLFLLFVSLPLSTVSMGQSQPKLPGANGQPGKMPPISEDELNDMVKMLETLDQETLDALAKIGEEYIQEMESQGKDPFEELFGVPTPDEFKEPTAPVEPAAPIVEKPKEVAIPHQICAEAKECRRMLKNIADLITTIRIKAENDRKIGEALKPWKYHLDDIVYFAHALSEDKLLKYITDKEFEKLYKAYAQLEHELSYLAPQLIVPETGLEAMNPYTLLGTSTDSSWQEVNTAYQKLYKEKHPDVIKAHLEKEGITGPQFEQQFATAQDDLDKISGAYNTILQKEQALQVLKSIVDSFSKAVYTNDIIGQSRKVLEKYEPEALKLKEEQDELEKQARKQQEEILRRRPQYVPPVFEPSRGAPTSPTSDDYGISGSGVPDSSGGATSRTNGAQATKAADSGKPGAAGGQGKPGEAKSKDSKDGKDDKDKKSDRKPKAPEGSARIKKKLGQIQKDFEAIATEIDEQALAASPEDYAAGKKLFDKFDAYLTTEYQDDEAGMKLAKGINTRLINMTNKLKDINREISDDRTKDLNKAEKKDLQVGLKNAYDVYFSEKEKDSHFNKIKSLLKLPTTPVEIEGKKYHKLNLPGIKNMKANMHLAINETIASKLDDAKNKMVAGIRGKASPEYDILGEFLDNFRKLKNKVDQK